MDLLQLLIVFCASVLSSTFGTLVGGSSMITVPLLIMLGLPPHVAIGTDRLGTSGIGLAGLYSFHRQGKVNYRLAFVIAIPCLLGGFVGANLALQISAALLKKVIIVLTIGLLVFVMTNPMVGLAASAAEKPLSTGRTLWGGFLSFLVGIHGGFFGGGSATFLAYVVILVFRQSFLECAANSKVASFLMAATAAATYAYHGAIHLPLGLALFAGCCTGSFLGAHYSDRIGNVWIKRLFIGVVLLMVAKLLLDA
ncbi:MAG: sulfite exporter TauE/SafE family protein [Deltaproteobacteria bacterium]|nr:sulfite exporter TauE/SafE family protein [Deltaproteobacteria bacterium]